MIEVVCPSCGGDTLWRYPNLQWARNALPGLPSRSYRTIHGADPRAQGFRPCPDPRGHLEAYRQETREIKQ